MIYYEKIYKNLNIIMKKLGKTKTFWYNLIVKNFWKGVEFL